MIRRTALLVLALAVPALAQVPAETTPTVLNPASVVDANARFDYSDLDAILHANVVDGKVDYLAIRRDWWGPLTAYLERIAGFDPDTLPRNEKLALYINLYNATMIKTITERLTATYSCADDNKKIFNEPLVHVGNKTLSLNYLEHKLIRGTFQDPRVHGSLVCGGLGCPPLANFAFRGDILDQQLDARMAAWAKDNTRNIVDEKNKTIVLSKLFRSYAADFGGEEKAIAAVAKYRGISFEGYKVSFDTNYDWTLNLRAPRWGKWITTNSLDRPGEILEVHRTTDDKKLVCLKPFSTDTVEVDADQAQPYPPASTQASVAK
jgi:hypothetical protein